MESTTNHSSPQQPSNQSPEQGHITRYGLYGFIRDSLQASAAFTKPVATSSGTTVTHLSPIIAVSPVLTASPDLLEVMVQVDSNNSSSESSLSHPLLISGVTKLSQLQQFAGKASTFTTTTNSRLFEGVALVPFDAVLSTLHRLNAATSEVADVSGRSPRSKKSIGGMYMHPVDALVAEVLEDINARQGPLNASTGVGVGVVVENGVVMGTMSMEQDKKPKAVPSAETAISSNTSTGGILGRNHKILPIDLTIKTSSQSGFDVNIRESSSLPVTPAAAATTSGSAGKYVVREGSLQLSSVPTHVEYSYPQHCLCVEVGTAYHVLSDKGYRRLLAHAIHQQ